MYFFVNADGTDYAMRNSDTLPTDEEMPDDESWAGWFIVPTEKPRGGYVWDLVNSEWSLDRGEEIAIKTTKIKAEASRRILSLYDEAKQANMNAEATKLTNNLVLNGSYSAEEQLRADELALAWAEITDIRTRSNTLEGNLAGMTDQDVLDFNPNDSNHWI